MQPLLSILIATIEERREDLERVLKRLASMPLSWQLVEVIVNSAPRHDLPEGITVGEKRQLLLDDAKGRYVWFLDDDDDFTDDMFRELMPLLQFDYDVICAKTKALIDGKPYIIDTSIHYENEQLHDGSEVKRFPSVMNVYRRKSANKAKFKHINNGEDFAWSTSLGLTKEKKVDSVWHIYNYSSSKTVASKG